MKRFVLTFFLLLMVSFLTISPCCSQEEQDSLEILKASAPKIYIDCEDCDIDFIKTEITFVNYVRDRKEAQVHILITEQLTAGGGTEYTITFIGQRDYEGRDDTLRFVSRQFDTEDDIRQGIVRVLKMGLMRYVAKTPLGDQISISFTQPLEPTPVADRWKNWVFSINLDSWFDGEKTRDYISIYGSLTADRVTPDWKINLSLNASYNEDNFIIDDQKISSFSRSKSFWWLVVKSLTDHWSAGISGSWYSSTYSNIKTSLGASPAIEYNLFPYSESTRRQLRFLYEIGCHYKRYMEETIFDKTSETLFNEVFTVTLEVKQTWGSVETSLEGSHHFHDFDKNRLRLWSELSLRLFKGLSFDLYGQVSMIHNQLSLPKRGRTREEILLKRSELATQYDYFGSIGLSYTFGSIYSNVVNPRFGN